MRVVASQEASCIHLDLEGKYRGSPLREHVHCCGGVLRSEEPPSYEMTLGDFNRTIPRLPMSIVRWGHARASLYFLGQVQPAMQLYRAGTEQ